MTTEAKILNQITRYLDTLKRRGEPLFYFKIHGGPLQRAGLPDLAVVYAGRAIYLEVKAEGGPATPLQEHTMQQLRAAGAVCGVVRSVEEAKRLIFQGDGGGGDPGALLPMGLLPSAARGMEA